MASASAEFSIKADNSEAMKALEETKKATEKLLNAAEQAGPKMEQSSSKTAKNYRKTKQEVDATGQALRKAKGPADALAKSSGKLASSFKAAAAAIAAAATAAGALGGKAITLAGGRETATAKLTASAGSGQQAAAAAGADALASWGAGNGLQGNLLIEQASRLVQAGMSVQESVAAVQQAWILAGRNETEATQIVEKFAETAAAVGETVDPMIGTLEGLGIDVRSALAAIKGMSLEDVAAAAAAGKISVQDMLAATTRLSSEGTARFSAFTAAGQTFEGQLASLKMRYEEALIPLGEQLLPALLDGLQAIEPCMPELTSAVGALGEAAAWVAARLAEAIKVFALLGGAASRMCDDLAKGKIPRIGAAFSGAYQQQHAAELRARAKARQTTQAATVSPAMALPAVVPVTASPAAAAATAAAEVPAQPSTALGLTTAGAGPAQQVWRDATVQDSLAAIGGGGRRLSWSHAQNITIQQQTAKSTAATAANTARMAQLLEQPMTAVLA